MQRSCNKAFITILIVVFATSFSCKKDNTPTPDNPQTRELIRGYAVVDQTGAAQLILSTYEQDFIEDFSGAGKYVSLDLQASGISVVNGEILLPAGTYSFDKSSLKIVAGDKSIYSENMNAPIPIITGNIVVAVNNGNYDIRGKIDCSDNSSYNISFEGIIGVDPGSSASDINMKNATVYYDNKLTTSGKSSYIISFDNMAGIEGSIDLATIIPDDFSLLPSGTYTYSATKRDAGTLLKSDASFYKLMRGGVSYPVQSGSVTLTKSGDSFTLTGKVGEIGKRELQFSHTGPLAVKSAKLGFHNGRLSISGRSYGFNYFDYYLTTQVAPLTEFGEKLSVFLTGPIEYHYQYLPMAKGVYEVYGGQLPMKPYLIGASPEWSKTGFVFADKSGKETHYKLTSGALEIIESTLEQGLFSYKVVGSLTGETPTGETMSVDVTWDGVLDDATDGANYIYSYTTHPFSTLTGDISESRFTHAYYESYGDDFWTDEGGPDDRGYVEITLMTESGYLYEWLNEDGKDPNNHYMIIGLNLDKAVDYDNIVPIGTFVLDKEGVFASNTFMPGNFLSGITNWPYGTIIFNGDFSQMAPWNCGPNYEGGQIVITKNGDIYTITAEGYDDLGSNSHRISATYTGEIMDIYDAPTEPLSKSSVGAQRPQAIKKLYKTVYSGMDFKRR